MRAETENQFPFLGQGGYSALGHSGGTGGKFPFTPPRISNGPILNPRRSKEKPEADAQ